MNEVKTNYLEKFKDISHTMLVVAAILYFFGFLTVNSYLSRFGIVSFDVINARYLIAGILCLIPVSFVYLLAWHIGTTESYVPFSSNEISDRIKLYLKILFLPYFISHAVGYLFQAARIETEENVEKIFYIPSGKYSFPSSFFPFLEKETGINFVLKHAINISFYLIATIALFYLIGFLLSLIPEKKSKKVDSKKKTKKMKSNSNKFSNLKIFFGRCTEAFMIGLIIGTFLYAYNRIRVDIFDFNSFQKTDLDNGTLFAWFFLSLVSTFALITYLPKSKSEVQKKLSTLVPYDVGFLLQMVLTPIFVSIFLYGQTVFPRIPYMIGGGQPREISIELLHLYNFPDKSDVKYYLIGESSQFLYVVSANSSEGKAFQLNKNEVGMIRTMTGSGFSIPLLGSGSDANMSSASRSDSGSNI